MKRMGDWRSPTVAALTVLIAVAAGLVSAPNAAIPRPGPGDPEREFVLDWDSIFDKHGNLRVKTFARLGGRDAVFLEDRISDGTITDISVLQQADNPTDSFVYNGLVSAPHDLGNAYVLARVEGIDLLLDVRIERLSGETDDESYIEIELNHGLVALNSGHRFPAGDDPAGYELRWPFRGERETDDLLVRLEFVGRAVSSVEFKRWSEVDGISGYHTLEASDNLAGDPCLGIRSLYLVCAGMLTLDPSRDTPYISNGDPEMDYEPDSFAEININVGRLVGLDPEFTTVMVRTPRDIAFGSFRTFGQFSEPQPDETTVPAEGEGQ